MAKAVAAAPDKKTAKAIVKEGDKDKAAKGAKEESKVEKKKAVEDNPAVKAAKAEKAQEAIRNGTVNALGANNGNIPFKCSSSAEPIPELEDPGFKRKVRRMLYEF